MPAGEPKWWNDKMGDYLNDDHPDYSNPFNETADAPPLTQTRTTTPIWNDTQARPLTFERTYQAEFPEPRRFGDWTKGYGDFFGKWADKWSDKFMGRAVPIPPADMAGPPKERPRPSTRRGFISGMPDEMPSYIPTSPLQMPKEHQERIDKVRKEMAAEEEIAKKREIENLKARMAEYQELLTKLEQQQPKDEPKDRRIDLNL